MSAERYSTLDEPSLRNLVSMVVCGRVWYIFGSSAVSEFRSLKQSA